MQSSPRILPPPNSDHRRQVFWQVWLPLVVFVIVFLVLAGLAVSLTSRGEEIAEQWAALSVVIVIVPTCLGGIFTFMFLAIGIFLSDKAIRGLPGLTYKIQLFFRRFSAITRYYADRFVSPIIKINGKCAGLTSLFKPKRTTGKNN